MAGALTAAIAAAFSGGAAAATDPYFEYTTLLLPGSGTNGAQNNTFLDGSTNNFTITRNGNTTQGTFSPFSQTGWGNYFDGSSYLANTSTTSVVAPGTSNFTAEFWVYATTDQQSQAYGTVLHVGSSTAGCFLIALLYSSAGAMKIRFSTTTADYDSTSTISTNRWYHIAVVREGTGSNQTKMYVDGSLFHTFTLSDNLSNSSGLYIGTTAFNVSVRRLSGYVSNIRLTNGTALYTGAFTPSATPLTTTSQGATATQVELLACQSNRFLDNSSNGWVFTTSGSPTVVAFSPFNPTASWSAATNGGSGYFDGSGDYLSVASNAAFAFGTGDLSITAWIYPLSVTGIQIIVDCRPGGTGSAPALYLNGTTISVARDSSNVVLSGGTATINQWQFIEITRTSGDWRIFLNGTSVAGPTTNTTNFSSNSPVVIGLNGGGSQEYTGYMSSVRILKGTGGTTSTVPTAPLTAITNTSLLLNFTNAGIYDATSKNDLETVGDAQISNAVTPKWGSTSIKFDGTGDYLNTLTTWAISGSEAYTLEAWIYPTTVSGDLCIYETRSSSAIGFVLFINSTGKLQVFDSTGLLQTASTTTLTANTWTYIALVRSAGSSTNTYYVNGTSAGTFTLASFATATNARIGARYDGVAAYNGYMQDFRITKGYARTITASPTAAFPTL